MNAKEKRYICPEDRIFNVIKFIRREIIIINDLIQQHLDFVECSSDPKLLTTINIAHSFFTLSIDSIRLQILLRVCRLFEDNSQSLTIMKLVSEAEQTKKLMSHTTIYHYQICNHLSEVEEVAELVDIQKILNEFKCKLNAQSTLTQIKSLKIVRDKVLAHNDLKYVGAQETNPPIPLENINELMEFADKVCSFCELRYSVTVSAAKSSNSSDLKQLLESITI